MANKIKIILQIILSCFALQNNAQILPCGETTDTLVELTGITTLCRYDTLPLNYNAADNTSNLPDYAYIIEGPNGLTILEDSDSPIVPAQLGATEGDTIYISGIAYDIFVINIIIEVLSDFSLCVKSGDLGTSTCQAISYLYNQGGISSLDEGLDLLITVDALPPIPTTEDVIDLAPDLDSQASPAEGFCVAFSNNGMGKDYYYIVENCCSAQQTINLNNTINTESYHIAKEIICLGAGFYTNSDFSATIENCP